MPLTIDQIQQIREIIANHHSAYIVGTLGASAVAAELLEKLKAKGMATANVDVMREVYLYGLTTALTNDPKIQKMNFAQFKEYARKNPVPVTETEERAIAYLRQSNSQYLVGLGNKIDQATGQLLIEADQQLRAKTREGVTTAAQANVAKRESIKKLKSDLGWMAKDWARDWDRIAVTEKQVAMQTGVADGIAENYGSEAYVAKMPAPDACPHCKRLYLGPDGHPRIFRLKEMQANGINNFGRKVADWLPVYGAVHPNCGCQLIRVPDGWGFDETGSLVPDGEFGVRYDKSQKLKKALETEAEYLTEYGLNTRVHFAGLPVVIENRKGSTRVWTDAEGNQGETVMRYAYGYIEGTQGTDGDAVDVFLGPDPTAETVYLVDQKNPARDQYDELKAMLGFASQAHAKQAYLAHYDNPDFLIAISPIPLEQFKAWLGSTGQAEESRKIGAPGETFVIFEKSAENIGQVGATNSPAGNRSPGPGTVANVWADSPEPTREEHDVSGSRQMLAELVDREIKDNYPKASLDDYRIQNVKPKSIEPFNLPVQEIDRTDLIEKKAAQIKRRAVELDATKPNKALFRKPVTSWVQ